MHWRNVGGCRVYSTWWSPASCSSTSLANGWTSSRPLQNRGPFPTATFCVFMEVRVTVYSSYRNHSEVKVSVNKNTYLVLWKSLVLHILLTQLLLSSLLRIFGFDKAEHSLYSTADFQRGFNFSLCRWSIFLVRAERRGRILKRFVSIKFLSVQPSFRRAL